VDLDAVAAHADLDLEPAYGTVPAFRDDTTGNAAGAAVENLDVMRPEDQHARPARAGAGADLEGTVVEEQLSRFDGDRQRVGLAHEACHERRRRTIVDLVGRADLLDLAAIQHHDAVGELDRLLLVVGNEDGGVTGAVVDLAQPAAELAADLGVERAE